MQALAQMGDAAADAVDLGAGLREALLLPRAQLQQFAAVVEGELVVVLPRAVGDHPVRLRKGVHQVLHLHGGPGAAEDQDAPAAPGGVVEHPLQLLLLSGIARGRFGWLGSEGLVQLAVRSPGRNPGAVLLKEGHAADGEAAHPAVLPCVEAILEAVEPVLEGTVAAGKHPEFHLLSCRSG